MPDIAYGEGVCSENCDNPEFECSHSECRNYAERCEEPKHKCEICGYGFGVDEEVFHFGNDYYHVDCFTDAYMETIR